MAKRTNPHITVLPVGCDKVVESRATLFNSLTLKAFKIMQDEEQRHMK